MDREDVRKIVFTTEDTEKEKQPQVDSGTPTVSIQLVIGNGPPRQKKVGWGTHHVSLLTAVS